MPLKIEERFYKPTEETLEEYLWWIVYDPIIEIMERYRAPVVNSKDALLTALRRGSISYADGKFSGDFTSQISRTLRTFADFDKRSGEWVVKDVLPSDVSAAVVAARDRSIKLTRDIESHINTLEQQINDTIENLALPINNVLESMDSELQKDISIKPEITDKMRKELADDYHFNQHLNIKDWAPEQVQRLRGMVEKMAKSGYRRTALRNLIQSEWGVTSNKAKFLARQETGLFLAKLRRERFLEAGIQRYRWSTSRDERVRDRHAHLHGKVFTFGDPPVTDDIGNRNEPGEDYNCRCVAIPLY